MMSPSIETAVTVEPEILVSFADAVAVISPTLVALVVKATEAT